MKAYWYFDTESQFLKYAGTSIVTVTVTLNKQAVTGFKVDFHDS
jgi:hypothetical protein